MLGTPSNSHAAVVKKVEKVAKIDQYLQHLGFKEKAEYVFKVTAENEAGAGEPAVTQPVGLKTHASKYSGGFYSQFIWFPTVFFELKFL